MKTVKDIYVFKGKLQILVALTVRENKCILQLTVSVTYQLILRIKSREIDFSLQNLEI